jgi:hypothetical protein
MVDVYCAIFRSPCTYSLVHTDESRIDPDASIAHISEFDFMPEFWETKATAETGSPSDSTNMKQQYLVSRFVRVTVTYPNNLADSNLK